MNFLLDSHRYANATTAAATATPAAACTSRDFCLFPDLHVKEERGGVKPSSESFLCDSA